MEHRSIDRLFGVAPQPDFDTAGPRLVRPGPNPDGYEA
jgi:hypothetical protein